MRSEQEIRHLLEYNEAIDKILKAHGITHPEKNRYIARHILEWVLEKSFRNWMRRITRWDGL